MKQRVFLLFATLMILCVLFLSACAPDTSQPWKDDQGHWHTHRVCQTVTVTHYLQVPAGEDKNGITRYISVPHQSIESQCTYE